MVGVVREVRGSPSQGCAIRAISRVGNGGTISGNVSITRSSWDGRSKWRRVLCHRNVKAQGEQVLKSSDSISKIFLILFHGRDE